MLLVRLICECKLLEQLLVRPKLLSMTLDFAEDAQTSSAVTTVSDNWSPDGPVAGSSKWSPSELDSELLRFSQQFLEEATRRFHLSVANTTQATADMLASPASLVMPTAPGADVMADS